MTQMKFLVFFSLTKYDYFIFQLQKYDELREAYKQLETKYNQLLELEERYKKDQTPQKEKINSLENELLIAKSTQNHHQDLQATLERLQTELQLSVIFFKKKFLDDVYKNTQKVYCLIISSGWRMKAQYFLEKKLDSCQSKLKKLIFWMSLKLKEWIKNK